MIFDRAILDHADQVTLLSNQGWITIPSPLWKKAVALTQTEELWHRNIAPVTHHGKTKTPFLPNVKCHTRLANRIYFDS